MRPDKPGEWHSRDGRRIVVFADSLELRYAPVAGFGDRLCSLSGDDWLPAVAPTFPELPPKPVQCLVRHHSWLSADHNPVWRAFDLRTGLCVTEFQGKNPATRYVVVPHPDNDPEAVALINKGATP